MKKFFVPSKWEKNAEALKFTTIKRNLNGAEPSAATTATTGEAIKKKNKKRNKKTKQKAEESTITKGPLAPVPPTTPKVKTGRIEKKKNKQKQKKLKLTNATAEAAVESLIDAGIDAGSEQAPASALEAKFKEQLMGGRFRYINEQLYTIDSEQAQELFKGDRDAFAAYHDGYRHQVEKWPLNPLSRIIKTINKLPRSLEIGDFGCGEGQLAKSVPHKVYSMDLVSCRDDIIACDMARTPLKPQTLDVAVYCLSLMGTNLYDYLLEANRVLKIGGFVYIAEIQSRFDDVYKFVKCLDACGFELIKKDVSVKLFYFFHFKKVRDVGKVARLQPYSLKPCLYRKR